jgi:shikimate dehydrogenase
LKIDASTELLGVVGHPVSHSLSPVFWNEALRQEGRNAVFLAFDVVPQSFGAFVAGMSAAGARGVNVTMPHKSAALEASTRHSEDAERTGAANVLVFEPGEVVAHNTDVVGVLAALGDLGIKPAGKRVLVAGAGGAGRAAVWALRGAGAEVLLANRTSGTAETLAEAAGATAIGWDDLGEAACEVEVFVNTTTVGLDGRGSVLDRPSLERAVSGRLEAVFDAVYGASETPLVIAARAAGLQAQDGLGMLVHQAAAAWKLFFGAPPPFDVMQGAARRAAGRGTSSV